MIRKVILFICIIASSSLFSQENGFIPLEVSVNRYTTGTLLAPERNRSVPLVIFVQGAEATDRNGNQAFNKNDAPKQIAQELAKRNIASYRFDNRIFSMRELGLKEKDMRFEDFIADASAILDFFKKQERFNKIIVAGYGEGSLIGMVAAQEGADAFISIAGAAQPIHHLLLDEVGNQLPSLRENAANAFKEMEETGSTSNYDPVLEFIFRPDVQPYMLSRMKFDPSKEIAELDIPVLIINGTRDIKITQEQAKKLKEAKPDAELVIIPKMNHVLKIIEGGDLENAKSYNEPERPVAPQLVDTIIDFIKTEK